MTILALLSTNKRAREREHQGSVQAITIEKIFTLNEDDDSTRERVPFLHVIRYTLMDNKLLLHLHSLKKPH
jgi:hypothetical protein